MDEKRTEKFLFEMRSRITDVMAAMQVLLPLVREKGSEKDQKYFAAMNKSLYRMLRSMHHMTVCTEEPIVCWAALDLAGLCRDVGGECESHAKTLGISFTWSLEQSSVISVGNDKLLEMALLNLLANAFEAAGPGGRVTLRGEQKKDLWLVSVSDDGPGLRQTEEEDPFLKKPGGVGLGLEVVRTIAELHGGRVIRGDRKEGQGTTAVLSLPIQKPTGKEQVRTPIDLWGGISSTLVEFSHLLPAESFSIHDTE